MHESLSLLSNQLTVISHKVSQGVSLMIHMLQHEEEHLRYELFTLNREI